MEEGLENQITSPQLPNWLLIVSTIILTSFIVGGGVFIWQNSKLQTVREENQQEIEGLNQQIQSLNQEIERLRESEIEEGVIETSDLSSEASAKEGWKTYRNKKYGFEMDHPTTGWDAPFPLCKKAIRNKERFCIFKGVYSLHSSYSLNKGNIQDAVFEEFIYLGKEITTEFGVKGYEWRRFPGTAGAEKGVIFAIPKKIKCAEDLCYPLITFSYYVDSVHDSEDVKIFNRILSTFRFINPVAEYLEGAELQYETDVQKENIATALNDILNLPAEELKKRRYKDYTGKEKQWDLPTLIYRHFVPQWPGTTLGDNFYQDVKSKEAQEQVKQIFEKYFK